MKRKFAIVVDSGADMPAAYYEQNQIEVVPLGFALNDILYEGETGLRMTEKEFYSLLRSGSIPTTCQVTAERAKPHVEKYLQEGRDVFILALSSALSGTAGSFFVAARELSKKYPRRKIVVVDSLCASMGQGLLLDYLVKKAEEGASIEEAKGYIEGLKGRICHHFTVDNLFHLKRGGRISQVAAFFGSVLKIKPIMRVSNEGKLVAVGKVIGRKKSLTALVENVFSKLDSPSDPIFINHADCEEDLEFVKKLIYAKLPSAKLTTNYIGAVIGAHGGADALAIYHKGTSRE